MSLIFLFATGCTAASANCYWQRSSAGFPNQVFIYEQVLVERDPWLEIKVTIPQIGGAADENWQAELNAGLKKSIEDFAEQIRQGALEAKEAHPSAAGFPHVGQVDYAVTLNKGGLLSLTLSFYQYTGGAHGLTHLASWNLDLTTGRFLGLADFLDDSAKQVRLVEIIQAQIEQEPDWFFIQEFTLDKLQNIQGFYLEEKGLVVYFPLYELAPYVAGIQKFLLPYD